ncbi:unnamed protein product [Orchesella dallaii]|uniref:Uncharacterized protein n=1 Tax=Orchesella dallaii TaxID=48710 RepID=A0ABP1QRT2_9HEXA
MFQFCIGNLLGYSFVLLCMEILTKRVNSEALKSEPGSPKPPNYSGHQYFPSVKPISCTTQTNSSRSISIQNGMNDTNYRWKSFNIFLDDGYSAEELSNIQNVMWTLSQILPCIPFGIWPSNSTPTGDYVHVIRGSSNGCSSYVGKQGGRQVYSIRIFTLSIKKGLSCSICYF